MTHFNRYAKNEVSDLNYQLSADIQQYSVKSIVKNKDQENESDSIASISHGNKNDPGSWLLV